MQRVATVEDFKVGNSLFYNNIGYTILRKYDDGIWEARTDGGDVCVFEVEADCYKVKI